MLTELRRRLSRAPINPFDRATVVSIFPKVIVEEKYTLQPGKWTIPAGTFEKPGFLIIGPSSWWKDIDPEQPLLEIPVPSISIADSIVRDYCNGFLGYGSKASPGLFYIPGELKGKTDEDKLASLKIQYSSLLNEANTKQREWYHILVRIADTLWSRSNGNPLAISDDMRLAARELNLHNKQWLADFQTMELKNCPACGHLRNNNFPMCPNCKHIIDKVAFEQLSKVG